MDCKKSQMCHLKWLSAISNECEKSWSSKKISNKDFSSLWAVPDDTKRIFSIPGKFGSALALCALFSVLLLSCSTGQMAATPQKETGLSQSYTNEKFTLELQTSKKEITIAEQLELVLETAVPENMEVDFPDYSASLGDFTLKDTRILPARMTGSGDNVRVVHQAIYLLEPYLSGTYTIPAMTVTFRDKQNDTEDSLLVTEQIEVAVGSLLPANTGTLDIKDIKPPLSLPPNRAQQFLLLGILLLLAILAVAGLLYWKKMTNNKVPTEVQPRPEEIALQELDRLLAENLLARGEVKLFHLRISDILRRYIENRFGLKAPERTTEEFLMELSQAKLSENALLGSHKTLLTDFLTQCDLVKFAKHEPTIAESEKTVVICREFVGKTREKVSRGQGVEGKK